MEEALDKITATMDERIEKIMASFDVELQALKDLGHDFPGYEEWAENFDEEKWRAEDPDFAAQIDAMLAAPEGGYLGDIDIEEMMGMKSEL